jgi:cyanophycin synthetase
MWREAAADLGARVRRLSPTLLEFRLGDARARVRDHMTTPFTDRVSHALALNKPLAYEVLADKGVPVPDHAVIRATDLESARLFLECARRPLIVKPASGGGGAGIVGSIYALTQLERALLDVGRFNPTVLVEEQVEGDSYRLLFLDGALLGALKRPRPILVGDGMSTVEELMFLEYERRLDLGGDACGFKAFEVDLDSLFALDRAGLGLKAVLPNGEGVAIKSASNYVSPENVETIASTRIPAIVGPARAAAEALGVRLAGVDVITTDPRRPLHECGVVVEVNPVPGLLQHYQVADHDTATPVAAVVLAKLLGSALEFRPEPDRIAAHR